MSDRTPQQKGRDWEPVFAQSIGAQPVKNSGAGFLKLDVRGSDVLFSLKWSGDNRSIRLEDAWMDEALRAIHAPGGIGMGFIPCIATKTFGYEMLSFRKMDAINLMTSEAVNLAAPSTSRLKKPLPEFLRGSEEE